MYGLEQVTYIFQLQFLLWMTRTIFTFSGNLFDDEQIKIKLRKGSFIC